MSITILIYGNTDEQNRSIAIITAIIIKKKIQSKKKKQQQQKRSIFFAHYSRYSTLHCCYFYLLLFPGSIKPQTFQTSNRFATLQPSKLASETGKGGGEAY